MTLTPRARAIDELADHEKLADLGAVGGVRDRPRTQSVAEAQGDVELGGDVEETVEVLVEIGRAHV